MKKVGVILSGCGVLDGSEIHESVLALLAIDRAGATANCLAPDMNQRQVTDHLRKTEVEESRNVLVEAARIARGSIRSLGEARAAEFDAIVIPGGYGAALNLSDAGIRGAACDVEPMVERFLLAAIRAGRPIGALCIAPLTLGRVLQKAGVRATLTIGNDPETAGAIAAMGHEHLDCPADQVVVDAQNRIVTSPAYMLATRISEVAAGAEALVRELLRLTG